MEKDLFAYKGLACWKNGFFFLKKKWYLLETNDLFSKKRIDLLEKNDSSKNNDSIAGKN
jgi:hypothetical protein